jgi:chromosome segregation ATPase
LTSFGHFERRVEWLEDNLGERERLLQEAAQKFTETEARVEELRQDLHSRTLKLREEATKTEETLAQHLHKSAAELTAKQMDIERLNASLEAAIAAKETMRHDFNAMNDELTEYRFKLGEKGIKLTPRGKHMSFADEEQDEKMRFSAEQKYLKSKSDARGGKYFMC